MPVAADVDIHMELWCLRQLPRVFMTSSFRLISVLSTASSRDDRVEYARGYDAKQRQHHDCGKRSRVTPSLCLSLLLNVCTLRASKLPAGEAGILGDRAACSEEACMGYVRAESAALLYTT